MAYHGEKQSMFKSRSCGGNFFGRNLEKSSDAGASGGGPAIVPYRLASRLTPQLASLGCCDAATVDW